MRFIFYLQKQKKHPIYKDINIGYYIYFKVIQLFQQRKSQKAPRSFHKSEKKRGFFIFSESRAKMKKYFLPFMRPPQQNCPKFSTNYRSICRDIRNSALVEVRFSLSSRRSIASCVCVPPRALRSIQIRSNSSG